MQSPMFYILTLSGVIFSHTLTATLIPISGSNISASIARELKYGSTNSTLGVPALPEGIDLTYEIGGPKLRITSSLMNAVATLKELALGDWDAKVIDDTVYKLDEYPEVRITVNTPKRKRNIRAGLVMWAILFGMYDMISKKKFELAQIQISWESQLLGWVHIINYPPSLGSKTPYLGNQSATLPIANLPINITNVITADNADDPDEARLKVTFEPYGDKLGIYDVFVPVMTGLTDMAKVPSYYESDGVMIGIEGFDGFICILPSLPLRTGPPVLNYGWLKRAVARIPAYMLSKGRFGEVVIKVTVDDVNVGFGRMSTSPKCDDDDKLISDS